VLWEHGGTQIGLADNIIRRKLALALFNQNLVSGVGKFQSTTSASIERGLEGERARRSSERAQSHKRGERG